MPPTPKQEQDGLSEAIERAEHGVALYVWQVDRGGPWRITDWAGVPDLDNNLYCGRVDLYGPRGVAQAVAAYRPPTTDKKDSDE